MNERPHKAVPSSVLSDSKAKAPSKTVRDLKERGRNALITGTAGGYLGGMLVEGKARVKIPAMTRKLLGLKRKTLGIHGARTGALAGALAGALNKGKRSDTVDSVATGGDWKFEAGAGGKAKVKVKVKVMRIQGKRVQPPNQPLPDERPHTKVMGLPAMTFSAYIEDMTFGELPKDVQTDVNRFVTADSGTPVVHYGMTVAELLPKADPSNLETARKNLGKLLVSGAKDEVLKRTKDGSKFVLLMNDRIIDGHHFLAKAERGKVTSSLNVLDLTPARLFTKKAPAAAELKEFESPSPSRAQAAGLGAAGTLAAGGLVLGTRGGRNALRVVLKKMDKNDPRQMRRASLNQKRKDASIARHSQKAVAKAREQFRAEAMPRPKKEPTLGDAVKTVKTRVKRKIVKSVANIGANPAEVQMGERLDAGCWMLDDQAGARQSRTQRLRDKIGLAKDVAGLGVTAGVGVGAHKLYKHAKAGVGEAKYVVRRVVPQVGSAVKAWHKAALKTGRTLDVVKDAVAPVASTNRTVAGAGRKIASWAKKASGMWMHGDPRTPLQFALKVQTPQPEKEKRDGLSKARDAALIGSGLTAAGAAGVAAHKAGKAVNGLAKRGRVMLRQVPVKQIGENLQNSTRISSDVGRIYGNLTQDVRKPKQYVASVKKAWHEGVKEGAAGPVKPWARRVVQAGKKLRLLEASAESGAVVTRFSGDILPDAPYGVTDRRTGDLMHRTTYAKRAISRRVRDKLDIKYGASRYMAGLLSGAHLTAAVVRAKKGTHFSEFGAGGSLLLSGAGTLIGSHLGGSMRYGVQNRIKKNLAPKIGVKWARRVGRVAGYAPEQVGAIAGGVAGSVLGGGIRRSQRVEMQRGGGIWPCGMPWEFGGREQLKDIDSSGFLDPLDVFVGRKKGYTAQNVKDYHRAKNYVADVRSKRRPGSSASVAAAEAQMKHIRSAPSTVGHGQVARSLMKKGDTVRRVAERGGGLAKDALAHLRGDPREKDASGRVKKREWEKPWFQRTKNQLVAGAALGGGYALLKGNPRLRARVDRGVRTVQRRVNKAVPDFFPGVKPLREKGQKTTATVAAKQQAQAQAKAQKVQSTVKQSATNIAQAAAAAKGAAQSQKKLKPKPAPQPKKFSSLVSPWPVLEGWKWEFSDALDAGWDIRDARGRSARVFAPGSQGRDRRPKQWHERVDNERKLWGAASLAGTLAGGLVTRKLMQNQVKSQVKSGTDAVAKRAARWKAVAKQQHQRLQHRAAAKPKIVSFPPPPKQAA